MILHKSKPTKVHFVEDIYAISNAIHIFKCVNKLCLIYAKSQDR